MGRIDELFLLITVKVRLSMVLHFIGLFESRNWNREKTTFNEKTFVSPWQWQLNFETTLIAPRNYTLFPNLKIWHTEQRFDDNEKKISAVIESFDELDVSLYKYCITKLKHQNQKYIYVSGLYVEKLSKNVFSLLAYPPNTKIKSSVSTKFI